MLIFTPPINKVPHAVGKKEIGKQKGKKDERMEVKKAAQTGWNLPGGTEGDVR